MNMFKTTSAKNPDEYIASLPFEQQEDMRKLHTFITRTVPKLNITMQFGMIGYGTFHYKSKSGREGDWCIVALARQKNYISVYICAVTRGKYVAEHYVDLLPKANIGKSCIRFKKLEDIDLDVLGKILKEAVDAPNFLA